MLLVLAGYRTGSTTLCWGFAEHEVETGRDFDIFFDGYKEDPTPYDGKVVKVFPMQLNDREWEHFKTYWIPAASDIVYSCRRDWHAQVVSYYVAQTAKQWHPVEVNPYNAFNEHQTSVSIAKRDLNIWGKKLRENYLRMGEVYKKHEGFITWLEDRPQQPYENPNIQVNIVAETNDWEPAEVFS